MEHPFINKSDLSNKSLEELQETLSSLTTKMNFAMASGNQPLLNQLRMAVTSYQAQHKKKLEDAKARISVLEEQLSNLK